MKLFLKTKLQDFLEILKKRWQKIINIYNISSIYLCYLFFTEKDYVAIVTPSDFEDRF